MGTFRTDYYFHIGYLHITGGKPCQDYALSGLHQDEAFAVVSDGCSTGRHTDVGSRLISFAVAAAIRERKDLGLAVTSETAARGIQLLRSRVLHGDLQSLVGLRERDLAATCVYAHLAPDGGFLHVWGDGAVAIVRSDGSMSASSFYWANNTPFYPVYGADSRVSFIQAHGCDLNGLVLTEERRQFSPEQGWEEHAEIIPHTLMEGIAGITIPCSAQDGNKEKIACVAVFSDGVMQVCGLAWTKTVQELLAFKSRAGEFAKRRMIRFIKDARKIGKGPLDDIAYAVIRVVGEDDREDASCLQKQEQ